MAVFCPQRAQALYLARFDAAVPVPLVVAWLPRGAILAAYRGYRRSAARLSRDADDLLFRIASSLARLYPKVSLPLVQCFGGQIK